MSEAATHVDLSNRFRQALGGRSVRSVARLLGISEGAVRRWITGTGLPEAKTLAEFCRITEVSADYLLGLDEDAGRRPLGISIEVLSDLLPLKIRDGEDTKAFVVRVESAAKLSGTIKKGKALALLLDLQVLAVD